MKLHLKSSYLKHIQIVAISNKNPHSFKKDRCFLCPEEPRVVLRSDISRKMLPGPTHMAARCSPPALVLSVEEAGPVAERQIARQAGIGHPATQE